MAKTCDLLDLRVSHNYKPPRPKVPSQNNKFFSEVFLTDFKAIFDSLDLDSVSFSVLQTVSVQRLSHCVVFGCSIRGSFPFVFRAQLLSVLTWNISGKWATVEISFPTIIPPPPLHFSLCLTTRPGPSTVTSIGPCTFCSCTVNCSGTYSVAINNLLVSNWTLHQSSAGP